MSDLFAHADLRVATERKRTTREICDAYYASLEARIAAGESGKSGGICTHCFVATCPGCDHDCTKPCAANPSHKVGYRFTADDGAPANDGSICPTCWWKTHPLAPVCAEAA